MGSARQYLLPVTVAFFLAAAGCTTERVQPDKDKPAPSPLILANGAIMPRNMSLPKDDAPVKKEDAPAVPSPKQWKLTGTCHFANNTGSSVEPPCVSQPVQLVDSHGKVVARNRTDKSGAFSFNCFHGETYTITIPPGPWAILQDPPGALGESNGKGVNIHLRHKYE